jgi:hypothetical protein
MSTGRTRPPPLPIFICRRLSDSGRYSAVSKVKPIFTVTCQSATLLFSRCPRTSATSKPLHIPDRLASSRDRIVHCVFDSGWGGTD